MGETKEYVNNSAVIILIVIVLAGMIMLFGWANERYRLEIQRDCMAALSRPDPTVADYDDKMLEFTEGVRACL